MSSYLNKINDKMTDFSNNVANNLLLTYLIAVIVGSVLFFIIIIFNNWNWSVLIAEPSILGLTSISGIVLKFISGIGISVTYGTVCVLILKAFSGFIKGNKSRARILKIFLIVIAGAILGYGVYIFILNVFFLEKEIPILGPLLELLLPPSLFDQLLELFNKFTSLILGLWSLILFVDILPAIREELNPMHETTRWESVKEKFAGMKYSLWKGYHRRVHKDYGKVFKAEYGRYKEDIEQIRAQLSGLLLLPFTIILITFPVLMGVAFVLWIRLFSQDKKIFTRVEKILLIFIISVVLVASTIIFLFVNVKTLIPLFNIAYAIGIFISMFILSVVITRA